MSSSSRLSNATKSPDGVRYARWAGHVIGLVLILQAGHLLGGDLSGAFPVFKAVHFLVFGAFLTANFQSLNERLWKLAFVLGCALTVVFVFIMIASVMFDYMAAAEAGERLGVPGLEGTLIFVALLQVPALLFQRRPDLMD